MLYFFGLGMAILTYSIVSWARENADDFDDTQAIITMIFGGVLAILIAL